MMGLGEDDWNENWNWQEIHLRGADDLYVVCQTRARFAHDGVGRDFGVDGRH